MKEAYRDYVRYSGKEGIEIPDFLEWAALYGISPFIICYPSEYSVMIKSRSSEIHINGFEQWIDAVDGMVSEVFSIVEQKPESIWTEIKEMVRHVNSLPVPVSEKEAVSLKTDFIMLSAETVTSLLRDVADGEFGENMDNRIYDAILYLLSAKRL